jgi:hypothetical protein
MPPVHYDLKTPCINCPFRSDVKAYIRPERVDEIERSLERGVFPCHKTVDYEADGVTEDDVEAGVTADSQHCAGALILLEKMSKSSQMMRVAENVNLYDRRKLDMKTPVYKTFAAMRAACEKATVGEPTEPEKLVKQFCCVADDDCKQPAGYRYGGRACANTEKKQPIPLCYQCGQPVCYSCSKLVKSRDKIVRLCGDCLDER